MAQSQTSGSLIGRARRLASGGTASILGSAVYSNALRIVSSMTLTRLLSAEAFGVVGIITSVTYILSLMSDIGMFPFVVRHARGSERDFLDEVWTLRLLRQCVLGAIMFAISVPIADFIHKPQLAAVIAFWSLSMVVEGLSSMSFATAVREQQLWRLTMLELISATAQLIFSIAAALLLHSYWALVAAMMFSWVLKTLLSYAMFPGSRRRFALSRPRARELWQFSRFIALSSILTLFIMQADKVALARLMPLAAYGFYAIATTLAGAPLALAHQYVTRILYPAYAAAWREGPERLAAIFYPKRRLIVCAYMAAVGGMIGAAPLIIAILYDPRYQSVTPYLQLVALSTAFYMPNNAAEEGLVAAGRQRYTLYANIVRAVWLIGGGAAAIATHDILLLVAVFGLIEPLAQFCYWWGLKRIGVLRLREEALGWVVLAGGAGLGWGLSTMALRLIPHL